LSDEQNKIIAQLARLDERSDRTLLVLEKIEGRLEDLPCGKHATQIALLEQNNVRAARLAGGVFGAVGALMVVVLRWLLNLVGAK